MSDRRYRQPLPLGGEDGLPFSKGLMARALIAAGLSADRAYELALAVEADLAATNREATTMERLEEVGEIKTASTYGGLLRVDTQDGGGGEGEKRGG